MAQMVQLTLAAAVVAVILQLALVLLAAQVETAVLE
jgi:hypothetical protein